MNITDISFHHIHIQPPKSEDENNYYFPLHYTNEYTKPVTFYSENRYKIFQQNNKYELHIKSKDDLRFFNNMYHNLRDRLYDSHDTWFENKFERTKFNDMFKNYLSPNIEENAVNIQCDLSEELMNETDIKCGDLVLPTFELNSLLFDNVTFFIKLTVKSLEKVKNETFKSPPIVKDETNNIECELEKERLEENNNSKIQVNEDNTEKPVETKNTSNNLVEEKNELEEVKNLVVEEEHDIDNSDDEDECYVLSKIIESNIKENLSEELLSTFKKRQINLKNMNIHDIVYDSDVSESDDFENEYNNLV